MKVETAQALAWSEIDIAPDGPGVYAWYVRLVIGKADIEAVIKGVTEAKAESESSARIKVEQALARYIFEPYRESPYRVTLRGQLKPRFAGSLFHEPSHSDSLVSRLIENPERFRVMAEILRSSAPWFTAPLYIGMAMSLRARLRQHKAKIVDLRDAWTETSPTEPVEAGFASQVVARGFDPTNLFVHYAELDVVTGEHNDIENVLNRINYPIFGRN